MKQKQTKKEKRQAALKAALRLRVSDIVHGATSGDYVDDHVEDYFLDAAALSLIVQAVGSVLVGRDDDGKPRLEYLTASHNLGHYENIETITGFLFEHGIRA